MHYCYILYSKQIDRFYIGQTVDVESRLIEHKSKTYSQAYTAITNDWELYLVIKCENKTQAIKVERFIKKMKSKSFIISLKQREEKIEDILKKCL